MYITFVAFFSTQRILFMKVVLNQIYIVKELQKTSQKWVQPKAVESFSQVKIHEAGTGHKLSMYLRCFV